MTGACLGLGRALSAVGGSAWIQVTLLASALAAAAILPPEGAEGFDCWWQMTFGFDCPGCGLTRSFIGMAHGRYIEALELNVAGPFLFAAAAVGLVQRLLKISFQLEIYSNEVEDLVFPSAVVLMFANWGARIALG